MDNRFVIFICCRIRVDAYGLWDADAPLYAHYPLSNTGQLEIASANFPIQMMTTIFSLNLMKRSYNQAVSSRVYNSKRIMPRKAPSALIHVRGCIHLSWSGFVLFAEQLPTAGCCSGHFHIMWMHSQVWERKFQSSYLNWRLQWSQFWISSLFETMSTQFRRTHTSGALHVEDYPHFNCSQQ